jgi:hypothetical protein
VLACKIRGVSQTAPDSNAIRLLRTPAMKSATARAAEEASQKPPRASRAQRSRARDSTLLFTSHPIRRVTA